MAQKSKLTFRFVFNQRMKKTADMEESRRASQAIIKNVAFRYREGMIADMRGKIKDKLIQDFDRELSYTVAEFRRSVIGIPGGSLGIYPRSLSPLAAPSRAIPDANKTTRLHTDWRKRNDKYLRWKEKHFGTRAWFLNHGSVLKDIQYRQAWTEYFGPIRVTMQPLPPTIKENVTGPRVYGHTKVAVANISVRAMERITPSMLPVLASPRGNVNEIGNHRALMRLLPRDVGLRLGREPYRPGLEPFLGYVLTRAFPAALYDRIERGFGLRSLSSSVTR